MSNVINCQDVFDQKNIELRRQQKMKLIIAEFDKQYETEMSNLAKMISETFDSASKNDK